MYMQKSTELTGKEMIYELAQVSRDFLAEHNHKLSSVYEQMMERKEKEKEVRLCDSV